MTRIKVKSLGGPPAWRTGRHGPDHTCRISAGMANNLCAGHLPQLGDERIVSHAMPVTTRLVLQNISGTYWLHCPNLPIKAWGEHFNVEVE